MPGSQNAYRNGPDAKGHFGGQYVAETLMPLLHDLAMSMKRRR